MARITFSAAERARIAAILVELEPAFHDLTRRYANELDPQEWEFVVGYIRNELRSFLEIRTMAGAFAEAARDGGLADERGIADFLASRSWVRNFGVADDDDDRFMAIAATTGRPNPRVNYELSTDADTLLEIAEERLLGTIDDEYVELLRRMKA